MDGFRRQLVCFWAGVLVGFPVSLLMVFAAFLGALFGIIKMLVRPSSSSRLAFGPFLAVSAVVGLVGKIVFLNYLEFSKKGGCMVRRYRSFTMIELMVVISVILVLTAFTIYALGPARAKSRDSRRITDASLIMAALDQYYTSNLRTYPTADPRSTELRYFAIEINEFFPVR